MDTKFELGYTKKIQGSRWKHIINVDLPLYTNHTPQKQEFLNFMQIEYGIVDKRYSIRWTDHGADVRFESDADAASFLMLHTKQYNWAIKKTRYSSIRGH